MTSKYNYAKTLWKSAASFLQALVVVAPAHLALIDWEAGGVGDMNWLLTIGIPVGVAIIRAAMDYRKHGGKWAGPKFELPTDRFAPLIIGCAFVGTAGCAHNSVDFSETMADGATTTFSQSNIVTWGSQLDEGSGNMAYSWTGEGGGNLAVGNAATGAVAGDPTDVLLGVVQMLLQGYTARLEAPQPEPSPGLIDLLTPEMIDSLTRLRAP
jgi:hypothetical protein